LSTGILTAVRRAPCQGRLLAIASGGQADSRQGLITEAAERDGIRQPTNMLTSNGIVRVAFILSLTALCGCELVPRDTSSLLVPRLQRSEIFGFVAGLGTTFAAVPDLVAMLKRRSSAGMNPRMAAIMGIFQILWVYYGLLIASRPVIEPGGGRDQFPERRVIPSLLAH
jgi:hypothetical protein